MPLSPAAGPDAQSVIDALVERVREAQFIAVAPLAITRWLTAEPVPFAERERGERAEVAMGKPWAGQLFDCAWMRFTAQLPAGSRAGSVDELVACIDVNGELCVVDRAGVPVRGLTNIKSTFDPVLGGPGKTLYRVPPEAIDASGRVELWADAGLNDLFGFVKDEGRVVLAELVRVREDVRQLYYDVETLRDFWVALPAGDERREPLGVELAAVADGWECVDDASVAAARTRLAEWFKNEDKPAMQVHAIGHAHLDLAWLWPIRETKRKGARTFASALYNFEKYPEYRFGCSQPQLFAWMKEREPELYSKIKDAVRAGRIEPQGTFWIEPDCSMPSGEAFVRQVLHGAKFFKDEFGVVPDYCWQPDVFGYHGQLPQILRKSGHRFFMTQKLSWNAVNRFGHQSFHWEGIDGTRLLTHMLPEETYNGPAAARSLLKIANEYVERDVSKHALMVYGIGDGGGGPDAEHLERLRRAPKLPGLPAVRQGTVTEFFEAWSRDADKFATWKGELYLERHQGTLTTQALVKRNNRKAEIGLRELEWAAYLATTRTGAVYPAEALDRLWKEVLLYQFHDILPGSSIKRVYDECNVRYVVILAELEALTAERYASLVDAGVHGEMTVFNSLSWARREWVRHEGAWCWADVTGLGAARLAVAKHAVPIAAERLLENEYLRVIFAQDGRIESMWDKRARREVLATGGAGNDFVIIADTGDAWDFENDLSKKDVCGYLRRAVESPVLRERVARVDGPSAEIAMTWTYGASTIRQTVRLLAGAKQVEFATEADWQEKAMMLRVRFPVAVTADEARYEIPFGHIRRTTRDETSVEKAQIEVAALQWVDLSQADYGVALYNDCKHGFRVKGNVIDMALLRSVPHPGAALIGKGDADDGESAGGDGKVYGDLGRHVFRYALRPHAGDADAAVLTAEARAFNTPLRVVAGGCALAGEKFAAAAIEVAAVKPAEDGRGWIWRLVNVTERVVETTFADAQAVECDLMENATGLAGGTLRFTPFEIKTLRGF
ncbi:alpha-mannosidase [Rariglobus hedericola]|nr:glycoside hydrolase family 38 C-terminal domain-containing protein [Rariglobus hedericola]